MRVLITGITGFVGGHLAEYLLQRPEKMSVLGWNRSGSWPQSLAHLQSTLELAAVDMMDPQAVHQALRDYQPSHIFHLAGYANTGLSFREPDRAWDENIIPTRNLYQALHALELSPRILFASTGLIYGDTDKSLIEIDETTELRPASPYAASKAAGDLMSYQVSCSPGLEVMRVRLFNQIGPRQSADYSLANFARQIAAIERGQQEPILTTRDLSAARDLTDVRDMVRALFLVMTKGSKGEAYNAASGRSLIIREALKQLIQLSHVSITIQEQSDPDRQADTRFCRAHVAKLKQLTGWQPEFSLQQTLQDILNDWRQKPV